MSDLVKVDFHGDTILAVAQADGKPPLVVLKPIIERLGLDWSSQLHRIKRDELMAEGMVIITTPSPGGPQETVALPLNLLPGFLFGISEGSISNPDTRHLVQAYKRECHDVLYRHFFGGPDVPEGDPTEEWPWELIGRKIQLVREIRLTFGQKAAAALAARVGLPGVAPIGGATPGSAVAQGIDFVRQFLAERVDDAPGSRVQAATLFAAFKEWAEQSALPPMTLTAFGRTLTALGISRTTSSVVYYHGIRLKHRIERVD